MVHFHVFPAADLTEPSSVARRGRTFWFSIIALIAEAALAAATSTGYLTVKAATVVGTAIAAICGSHNIGRAWEDGKRNQAAGGTKTPAPEKKPERFT